MSTARRLTVVMCLALVWTAQAAEALRNELPLLSARTQIVALAGSPVVQTAAGELAAAVSHAVGAPVREMVKTDWPQKPPTPPGIYLTCRKALPESAWTKPMRAPRLHADGYAVLHPETCPGSVWIVADVPRGLLYGAYALLDRYGIAYEPEQPAPTGIDTTVAAIVSNPGFKRRWLGTGYWEYLSEAMLRELFCAMSRQRFNGFVAFMSLTNYADLKPFQELWGDPFGHLLEYRDYPKLQWRKRHGSLIDRASKHLNRLIDIASEYGIDVYLGSWEIGYPQAILEAYPELATPTPMSVSNPATERYVRSRFRELAARFPRIKGIMINGTESHSYILKSERLPDGRIISQAERRRRIGQWTAEALRSVIPDAVLIDRNGPAQEVKATCPPGTIFCPSLVDGLYYNSPRPEPKALDGVGTEFAPLPQGVAVDETSEYRGQNAFLLANIYGWASRIAPTYRGSGFDALLLGFTRTIPGRNPCGAYGLDVMNLYCLGALAWDPLSDPDSILHRWAQRYFSAAVDTMYRLAARSPEIFLGLWRKADGSGYVPRAPWFNYSGLKPQDEAAKAKVLRMAQEDVAVVEAGKDRLEAGAAARILGYLRARVRLADYLLCIVRADRATTLALQNPAPQNREAVEAALANGQHAAEKLDFPASPWMDFRGHVSPDFTRRLFAYFALQIRWLLAPYPEVLASGPPLRSDPARNVLSIKAVSAADQYFNSAAQLIDGVIDPTLDGQKVDPSAFSRPWIAGPGWPQGLLLEFVRQQPLEALTLHYTNVKSGTVWVRIGDRWQRPTVQCRAGKTATIFRFAHCRVSAVALIFVEMDGDGAAPAAMELTWQPEDVGGLLGQ